MAGYRFLQMHVYDHTETSISLHSLARKSGVITENSSDVLLLSVLEHAVDFLLFPLLYCTAYFDLL